MRLEKDAGMPRHATFKSVNCKILFHVCRVYTMQMVMVVKEEKKEEEEESESEKDELHVAYTASELRSSRLILQNFT